jgi:hypothetical protein
VFGSLASDVAVVVASLLGHVDGEEQAAGNIGVDGAPAVVARRSCLEALFCLQRGSWVHGMLGDYVW